MKMCTKCVLPETYPGIEFNEDGVCNYCLSYKKMEYKGKEALEQLVKTTRKNHKGEYDCVMGVSGGRDSSYALYYLVKVLNLKVLAYTADHGYVPEPAKDNIKRQTDIFTIPRRKKTSPQMFLIIILCTWQLTVS